MSAPWVFPGDILVPVNHIDAVEKWVNYGIQPGGFVTAVLQNDFQLAVVRADRSNLLVLPEWARLLDRLPPGSYGSRGNVTLWAEHRGLQHNQRHYGETPVDAANHLLHDL